MTATVDEKPPAIILLPVSSPAVPFSGKVKLEDAPDEDLYISDIDIDSDQTPIKIHAYDTVSKSVSFSNLPIGYYKINTLCSRYTRYIFVHPERCYLPSTNKPENALMVQLYSVVSNRNWGIGDFTDLASIANTCSPNFDYIGLNPLHALSPGLPHGPSPYSPDSRILLNELYLDIEEIASFLGYAEFTQRYNSTAFKRRIEALRSIPYIDYTSVSSLKYTELARIFRRYSRENERCDFSTRQFKAFVEKTSVIMKKVMRSRAATRGLFREKEADLAILFELFLQWHCERQLSNAFSNGRCHFYCDIAIGVSPSGTEVTSCPDLFDTEFSLGAPPDEFSDLGQKWNIAPLNISTLRETGYRFFQAIIRSNAKFAGALRLDNIAGLFQRFILPKNGTPEDGFFEDIPYREFFAILAIESHRSKCLLIGEDLGAVPSSLRRTLQDWGIMGCLVYQFEFNSIEEETIDPARQKNSIFSFSTHDCPPLVAFKHASDIKILKKIGRVSEQKMDSLEFQRAADWKKICNANPSNLSHVDGRLEFLSSLTNKVAPRVNAFTLDDILGEVVPINIPGTDLEYPNWRRKYSEELSPQHVSPLDF